MLDSLRGQLTSWFVGLFVALYCIGCVFGLVVFDSVLTAQLDEDLRELRSEIRPSVDFQSRKPTLKGWAENISSQQQLLTTIQLYDSEGNILERYGPAGVEKLAYGTLFQRQANQNTSVRSLYKALQDSDRNTMGYLQVQVSTKHRDDALHQFGLTLLIMAPFFALAVWFTGYFFSAKAVQPVGQTLDLLRRFVADAGHEFNTPITVIEASVQTLEENLKENESREILEVISRASARMRDLAASLMLLARMENPELVAKRTPIELNEILEPIVEQFESLAAQKNIRIKVNIPPNVVVLGNKDSLTTMISNLLDNALRYTDRGGTISLNVVGQESAVIMTVEDTGIGIPSECLSHIFERFYRVDKSRSRAAGGSGLGLSIVKAIVEAHKGVVKAESEVGKGTKFTVVLPSRVV
jgi:signal transduction histidine kinase